MKKCLSCNTENQDDAKYCAQCGRVLVQPLDIAPERELRKMRSDALGNGIGIGIGIMFFVGGGIFRSVIIPLLAPLASTEDIPLLKAYGNVGLLICIIGGLILLGVGIACELVQRAKLRGH